MAGLEIAPVDPGVVAAQLDLYLSVLSGGEGQDWQLELTYAADLFDEPRVRRLLDGLVGVLELVTADPSMLIGDLPI
ncbi:hypothetical protein, partial [Gordonia sp. ABSL49_1]|uniref:hypothetical protein n=1 Tax=Gordonia sp. ABSL49_1 TaxID=2920941 RepID=UPI001F0D74B8